MASPDYGRIRELFQQAVELAPENRTPFLLGECGDDKALQEAVERLLRHHFPDTLLLESEKSVDKPPASGVPGPAEETKFIRAGTQRFGETIAEELAQSAPGLLHRRTTALRGFSREKWPILVSGLIALILLIAVGQWCYSAIHKSVAMSLQRTMQALLDEQVFAIETWLSTEERLVESWARSPNIVAAIAELDSIARDNANPMEALSASAAVKKLTQGIDRVSNDSSAYQFAVWNREGTLIADSASQNARYLGNGTTEYGGSIMSRVFAGETVVWMPTRAGFITKDFVLSGQPGKGNLALITPVHDADDRPIASMLVSSPRMQDRFEQLLKKTRFGESSESYAVAEDGFLITESRFIDQLKKVRLIDDQPDAFSAQVIRVADPGGNLLEDFTTDREKGEWPLTRAATSVVAGLNGSDFEGYRDYRGVTVVGVWNWLPKYRFGIVAEVNYIDAYSPLTPLVTGFAVILGALGLAALIAIAASLALLNARDRNGEIARVGPYTLKSLLGEGGFARVYLASHALLKRPTAVKVLKQDQINKKNLVRFEREVQLASSLTHPNTIGIYDYGSTADGGFYYAMEFIKGLSLQELIDADGPQPAERVVWILNQVCRSLREAHSLGLIHRDIKPQNIMLCRHGGEHDTVKVLDFGLARNLDSSARTRVTETKLLIGTPLYIAPERIIDPSCMDPRSDIYSVGIVGYFLLTGREPFDATDSMDALAQTMNRTARRPSEQSANDVPQELDWLIRDCHSRAITERPATIEMVLQRLETVVLPEPWNSIRAEEWWRAHYEKIRGTVKSGPESIDKTSDLPVIRPS